ncbi:AmmeMemoRadiSam system protein A [Geosporobacter ferrireducens]|uniref:AMMECR1 domain-containing protein n=1 Tax=Geosporobacter ferrireducens TaxID=1424294 RepID=A0A1D8GJX4_9FIRM|nr:AmmeMemoRadiSam system protein A [Geosporobacter ferrireducens]AOT71211.1 AMMECR1 domain-containing protein [Geosporobacter ferrireducens]MTI58027.1 AmmeMemoRadiSam system protein A [Geosporobacter ferrireducens]
MGFILGTYLLPHPPIIMKEIGKGEEKKIQNTAEAMKEVARDIKDKKPAAIILITPHGPLFSDAAVISVKPELAGNMGKFGAAHVKFTKENHLDLTNKILQFARLRDFPCGMVNQDMAKDYDVSLELDHGTMVPLYFIDQEYIHYKLVHITYGLLPREDLYAFGRILQEAIDDIEENVVIIASGDLSHRLTKDAPAGFHPSGKIFDERFLSLLEKGDIEEIFALERKLSEEAGECGLRAADIMLGACDGYEIDVKVLSYEGPFGVGYGVVKIAVGEKCGERQFHERLVIKRNEQLQAIRSKEDAYVRLAREALEKYVREGTQLKASQNVMEEMLEKKAGVFVSIKKHGELRGCIGTISSTTANLAQEIIRNAIQAGTADPRFYPVEEEELELLVYSVDVLMEPETIQSLEDLDVKRYGVIVSSGEKSGLLLPNLEGVDTVEEQVRIALQKAGIRINEGYNLQRFEVLRHH